MRTASPNSVCNRIVAWLKASDRPRSTREVGDEFGLDGALASAQLCQLLKQGRVRKEKDVRGCGQSGHQSTWVSMEPAPAVGSADLDAAIGAMLDEWDRLPNDLKWDSDHVRLRAKVEALEAAALRRNPNQSGGGQ